MTRYTKTFLDFADNPFPNPFIGWDSLEQGSESVEATFACDVYKPLSATDAARFEALQPGEFRQIDGKEYFRQW